MNDKIVPGDLVLVLKDSKVPDNVGKVTTVIEVGIPCFGTVVPGVAVDLPSTEEERNNTGQKNAIYQDIYLRKLRPPKEGSWDDIAEITGWSPLSDHAHYASEATRSYVAQ